MDSSSDMIEKVQINGQRRIRRTSASVDGGVEIFIQNLPNNLYEEELWPLLEEFGEVCELRIMMNFSGLTRGFAYAKYADKKSAQKAVSGLNRREIRPGHVMSVQPSLDKKKLFITNLPTDMQTDEAVNLLTSLTANIENIDLFSSGSRRAIIVSYKTHQDAAGARRVLIPHRRQIFRDDNVVIEWATRKNKQTRRPTMRQQTANPWASHPPNPQPNPNHPANHPNLCATPQGRPLYRTYDQPGSSTFAVCPTFNQVYQGLSTPVSVGNLDFFQSLKLNFTESFF